MLQTSLLSSRRTFLQAGVLGIGGLTLSETLRVTGAERRGSNDRSVILFWLSGGPGHMETWDPKPEAPKEYRGPFGAISTTVPGIRFGELMPEQASLAEDLAVVRSVNHGSGDHTKGNHWMLTGYEGPAFNAPDNRVQRRPSIGSVISQVAGPTRPGLPGYVAVPHLRGGTDNLFHYATFLGGSANPFIVNSDPNQANFRVQNLTLAAGTTIPRLAERRSLLEKFDHLKRVASPFMDEVDAHNQAAFDLLTSTTVRDAFSIDMEREEIRDRYGRHTFGQSALLARRLVENGVRFVTVNCVPWDHHGSPGQYKTEEGARLLIPPMDRAVGALIEDLKERGLYEKTLVVAMGEFGRTPRMNSNAGRDHWGDAFSVLFGCGSMRMGQAIGASDRRGEQVVDRPIDPQDVVATVYEHLEIDWKNLEFRDSLDRPVRAVEKGTPIRELFL